MMTIDNHLYEIRVIEIIDGDTLRIGGLDHGFGLWGFTSRGRTRTGKPRYYSVRIAGINTPELRRGSWSRSLSEEEIKKQIDLGKDAKEHLEALWMDAAKTYIRSHRAGADNFGRLLGDIIFVMEDGSVINAGEDLIEHDLAKPYKE